MNSLPLPTKHSNSMCTPIVGWFYGILSFYNKRTLKFGQHSNFWGLFSNRLEKNITISNYIKRLCVSVRPSLCMSCSLLSRIKSVWKARGIVRTVLAMACYIPSSKKFHAPCLCNFTQFSHNLGFFSHFWANFNMLGIKKLILELRNSLVVLGEAIGLKKGPKAPKKRPKASKRGRRPPKALRRS